jgi:hypothetical protein
LTEYRDVYTDRMDAIAEAIDHLTEAVQQQRPLVPLVLMVPAQITPQQAQEIMETIRDKFREIDLMAFGVQNVHD